MYNNQE